MEPHNFLEEEIHNVHSIITLMVSNKVFHLGELIDNHHIPSFYLKVRGRAAMKPMLIDPKALKESKEECKSLGGMTLGHMTRGTPYDYFVDIPTHLGPIKLFLEHR